MAYQLTEFDDVALPVYNPRQQHDPMPGESPFLRSVGSFVDYFAGRAAQAASQTIAITGLCYGETVYLVDETGAYVVDEAGNRVISGSPATELRSQIEALRNKVRKRGRLVRIRLDDGARQWKTARFLQMAAPQDVKDRTFKAEVTCQFETVDVGWHSEEATIISGNAVAGSPLTLFVPNGGGMTIDDAVLTITGTSGPITQVDIQSIAAGINLRWTGSLATGQSLVIDNGAATLRKAGADAYVAGFVQAGHVVRGWLPLEQGTTALAVTTTGGNATVALTYYVQFP